MGREKILVRLMQSAHLVMRPMTLGVRVAAFDAAGRIFLVRHTYVSGWYLPGGGVDPGETSEAAARREMAEEGHLVAEAPLTLVSAHYNRGVSRRDHVLMYRVDGVSQSEPKRPDREIADCGFFAPDALPKDATEATLRRLDEIFRGTTPDPYW